MGKKRKGFGAKKNAKRAQQRQDKIDTLLEGLLINAKGC
jgi:hypothetical protein